jgi:protein-S-isoprenylcysteine O-methyltransferase Ste14
MKRLIPPLLFLICLAMMGLLRWLWPIRIAIPYPYKLLGMVPVLAGLLLVLLGVRQFRKAQTNIRPFRQPDVFVTQGPFRYSRNPMYLGLSVVLVGAWMLLGALSSVLGVLIFVVVADRWYIPFEERMLEQAFGAVFDVYCSRTRRWI